MCSSDLNLAASSEQLLVTVEDGGLSALELETGEIHWRQSAFVGRGASNPIVPGLGTTGAVGDYEGFVYLVDISDERRVGSACRSPWSPDPYQNHHTNYTKDKQVIVARVVEINRSTPTPTCWFGGVGRCCSPRKADPCSTCHSGSHNELSPRHIHVSSSVDGSDART